MDLVVHEVDQLQDVDVADGDRRVERLAAPTIEEGRLAGAVDEMLSVPVGKGVIEDLCDLVLLRPVEHGRGHLRPGIRSAGGRSARTVDRCPTLRGCPPEVCLEHLPEIHP